MNTLVKLSDTFEGLETKDALLQFRRTGAAVEFSSVIPKLIALRDNLMSKTNRFPNVAPAIYDEDPALISLEDDLEVREGLLLCQARSRVAHYINCNATQIFFQGGPDFGGISDFTDCIFDNVSFAETSADAEIHFYGKNYFYGVTFLPGQTIVLHDDSEFYNCHNLNIKLAEDKQYDLKISNSDVAFVGRTASDYANAPLLLYMNGGSLLLPEFVTYAPYKFFLYGVRVTESASYGVHTSVYMYGCTVQAKMRLFVNSIIGSALYFTDNVASQATLEGMIILGNVISSGTVLENNENKTGVVLNGEIDVSNRINMAHYQTSIGAQSKAAAFNYNGLYVIPEPDAGGRGIAEDEPAEMTEAEYKRLTESKEDNK